MNPDKKSAYLDSPRPTDGDACTAGSAEPTAAELAVDISDNATYEAGVPHAYFRALREHDPVHWQEECEVPGVYRRPGYWALTRYEDVAFVSKNSEIFSSGIGTSVLSELEPRDLHNMQQQLIHMDPPRHTQLRKLMNPPFKPRAVQAGGAAIRQIVCRVLDGLGDRRECDFVEDVSAPISLQTLTHFLGVPDKHSRKFYKWTNKMIGIGDPGVSSVFRARLAAMELLVYAYFLARKRRKNPTDDVYSRLVNGAIDGTPLDRLTLGMNFFLLVVAGNETTRNALSGGLQALCEHPDQFDLLRTDRTLLPSAIEEILRYVTPVMQFRRTATRDTQIGDQPIRKGEKVVMYYGAANRDPRVFTHPERFDITRRHNPHLAFGTGTHVCVGAHMARLTMRIALEELLERYPNMRIVGPVLRLRSNFISGIKRMPIALA